MSRVWLAGRPDLTKYQRSRIRPLISKALILGKDECWPWLACINGTKRGQFKLDGRAGRQISTTAPRASYILFVAPLRDDQLACHTCDNRLCINPHHLFAGSAGENMQDMIDKGRAAWQRLPMPQMSAGGW